MVFLGWLKVAQSIESPFGEDDSDFEMSSLIERHIRVIKLHCFRFNIDFYFTS